MQRDLPYELDATLRTLGTTDLGGSINTPKKFFGAHHRIVTSAENGAAGGRRLIGFNFSEEPSGGLLHFFEYDEQFRLLHKTTRLLKVTVQQASVIRQKKTAFRELPCPDILAYCALPCVVEVSNLNSLIVSTLSLCCQKALDGCG